MNEATLRQSKTRKNRKRLEMDQIHNITKPIAIKAWLDHQNYQMLITKISDVLFSDIIFRYNGSRGLEKYLNQLNQ